MPDLRRAVFRRALGLVWLAAWIAILVLLLDVWSELGGSVDERLRWWARVGLCAGPVPGWVAGLHAREAARWGSGRSHASLLRWLWLPVASATAVSVVLMTLAGGHDEARAALGAFLAYWAGFDGAIAAWPLACGRPYRFLGDIPPDAERRQDRDHGDPEAWL